MTIIDCRNCEHYLMDNRCEVSCGYHERVSYFQIIFSVAGITSVEYCPVESLGSKEEKRGEGHLRKTMRFRRRKGDHEKAAWDLKKRHRPMSLLHAAP